MAKIITKDYELDLSFAPLEMMTDEEFCLFCEQNKQIPIERDENHQMLFIPPVTNEYSGKNLELTTDLNIWNRNFKLGKAFDSSAGFFLPGSIWNAGTPFLKNCEKVSPILCLIL